MAQMTANPTLNDLTLTSGFISESIGRQGPALKSIMVDDGTNTGKQISLNDLTYRVGQLVNKINKSGTPVSLWQKEINQYYTALSNAKQAIANYTPQQAGRRIKRRQSKRRQSKKRRATKRRRTSRR